MSYGRRTPRGQGKKAQKYFAEQAVVNYANKLLYNRWKLLCPFPLEPANIYEALFTPEQHAAITLLDQTAPSIFEKRSEFTLQFDMPLAITVLDKKPRAQKLRVKLPVDLPLFESVSSFGLPAQIVKLSSLPDRLRGPIYEWANDWVRAAVETRLTIDRLDRLFEVCNTMGQVKRVWPNACNLLKEQARAALAESKMQSPYPLAVLDIHRDPVTGAERKSLKADWQPHSLAWYDDRLTEALCLPLMPDAQTPFMVEVEYAP